MKQYAYTYIIGGTSSWYVRINSLGLLDQYLLHVVNWLVLWYFIIDGKLQNSHITLCCDKAGVWNI